MKINFELRNGATLLLLFLYLAGCSTKSVNSRNARKGEEIFNSVGCTKCHSVTGESQSMYGPQLKFDYGKEISVYRNDIKVQVKLDREYIIRSLRNPDYEKLDGFRDKKMTPPELSDEEIDLLTDYLIYLNTKGKP